MLHLAEALGIDTAAHLYLRVRRRILERPRSPKFIAADIAGWQGLLKHAIYHQGRGLGVDESVMFGDYNFDALEVASRLEPTTRVDSFEIEVGDLRFDTAAWSADQKDPVKCASYRE
jgi:unsaturated chondroitin disaccharide hydrolase